MAKNVFQLERLELIRKDYPSIPAIYFISPTKESIEKLIQDFEDKPMYATVHLFFSTRLPDDLMEVLAKSEGLAYRIKTF